VLSLFAERFAHHAATQRRHGGRWRCLKCVVGRIYGMRRYAYATCMQARCRPRRAYVFVVVTPRGVIRVHCSRRAAASSSARQLCRRQSSCVYGSRTVTRHTARPPKQRDETTSRPSAVMLGPGRCKSAAEVAQRPQKVLCGVERCSARVLRRRATAVRPRAPS